MQVKQHVQHNKEQGFTLVEVMIALLLLLIMSLGTLGALGKTIQQSLRNQYRTEAQQIARDRIEELQNTSFKDIASSPTAGETITRFFGDSDKTFTLTQSVDEDTIKNSKIINITISWQMIKDGAAENYQVTTLRSDI